MKNSNQDEYYIRYLKNKKANIFENKVNQKICCNSKDSIKILIDKEFNNKPEKYFCD